MDVIEHDASFELGEKNATTVSNTRPIASKSLTVGNQMQRAVLVNRKAPKMTPALPSAMRNWLNGNSSQGTITSALAYTIGRSAQIEPVNNVDRFLQKAHHGSFKRKSSSKFGRVESSSPVKKGKLLSKNKASKLNKKKSRRDFKLLSWGNSLDLEPGSKRCLISLDSTFKQVWEALKFVMLTYQFYYLPLSLTFLLDGVPLHLYLIDKAIDMFFVIDIVLTFFTAIVDNHDIETDKGKIAKSYFKGWFIPDVLSVLPTEEIMSIFTGESTTDFSKLGRTLKAIRFVRFARMAKFLKLFKNFNFNDSQNIFASAMYSMFGNSIIMTVLPNFLVMLTLSHFFCCIWYALAIFEESDLSWTYYNGFQDFDTVKLYTMSLYSTIQTFSTTGYGDTLIATKIEMGFRVLIQLIGTLTYTLFSGQIMDHRSRSIEREEKNFLRICALNEIRKAVGLPDLIYYYVLEELQEDRQQASNQPRYNLALLSREDQRDFLYLKYINKFKNIRLFSPRVAHHNFVLELGDLVRRRYYEEGEVIYTAHHQAVLFYIIRTGTATVMMKNMETVPILELSNSYFGEYEIINSKTREFTVLAKTHCEVYYLQAADFKRIFLHKDPHLAQAIVQSAAERRREWHRVNADFHDYLTRKIFWRLIFKQYKQKNQGNKFKRKWLGDEETKPDKGAKSSKPIMQKKQE